MNYTKHKFNIFPDMLENDFKMLKQDIETKGYDNSMPITLFQGKIIDGWHRYKACEELQIKPVFVDFKGSESEAIEFIMRTNKRRNLTSSQWATIAVEAEDIINVIKTEAKARQVASLKQNKGNTVLEQIPERNNEQKKTTVETVAEIFNTNAKYIQEATKLKKDEPELYKQVQAGTKTIAEAKKDVLKKDIEVKIETLKNKKVDEIDKKYDVIVIDPAWEMKKIDRDVAPNQTDFDYPTMTIEEIKNFKIPAEDNCHLFLWTTQKYLPESFDILKEWGFKYVLTFVWHKNGGFQPFGLPQYNCEFVVYARKGTPFFIDTKDFFTCFNAKRTGHSSKPEEFYDMIRRVTAGTKIDIFNRRKIDGFDTYGNEANG